MSVGEVNSVEGVQVEARRHWLRRCFSTKGRASRLEFWSIWLSIVLFANIIAVGFSLEKIAEYLGADLTVLIKVTTSPVFAGVSTLFILLSILPFIFVYIRRLHDLGKSGWFFLICFIPYIGGLLLLMWVGFFPGNKEDNQYGKRV